MPYAVGGDRRWRGSMAAISEVWDLRLPPLQKLLAIAYADVPRTVDEAAEWTGLEVAEVEQLTDELGFAGIVAPYSEPAPPPAAGVGNRMWTGIRLAVLERDGHACRHCGTTEDLSIDHIYPRSRGGGDELENLQVLCRSCNSRKGVSVS